MPNSNENDQSLENCSTNNVPYAEIINKCSELCNNDFSPDPPSKEYTFFTQTPFKLSETKEIELPLLGPYLPSSILATVTPGINFITLESLSGPTLSTPPIRPVRWPSATRVPTRFVGPDVIIYETNKPIDGPTYVIDKILSLLYPKLEVLRIEITIHYK
ncbi:MAG: hypothetical protein Harvfovirus57_4 [Harvfovirus sp.]|uniref:Uncharacterized protein n=1 Tax=Harvfovirus sp. TaxID=2487768 RepID=A0A3G5A3D4_9VIRU|nr:MAG: hypothetical protein Harvfovirus57_4 [Harvfovirus sp.]